MAEEDADSEEMLRVQKEEELEAFQVRYRELEGEVSRLQTDLRQAKSQVRICRNYFGKCRYFPNPK